MASAVFCWATELSSWSSTVISFSSTDSPGPSSFTLHINHITESVSEQILNGTSAQLGDFTMTTVPETYCTRVITVMALLITTLILAQNLFFYNFTKKLWNLARTQCTIQSLNSPGQGLCNSTVNEKTEPEHNSKHNGMHHWCAKSVTDTFFMSWESYVERDQLPRHFI